MLTGRRRLAVWGDPIAHSLSPLLHGAAFRALGLDWEYGRRRVDADGFGDALRGLDGEWRGLSLTMPLKRAAFEAAVDRDRWAELSGAANTLLLADDGPRAFNTDVGGMARDLRAHGLASVAGARIVGAGATATSALLALASLRVPRVEVVARRLDAADSLVRLGAQVDIEVRVTGMDAPHRGGADAPGAGIPDGGPVALTIAALPGGVALAPSTAQALAAAGGTLYDVVYGHWPTDLARAWERAGAAAVAGRGMLIQQALLQVRVFVHGDPAVPLDREDAVLAAMRRAVTDD